MADRDARTVPPPPDARRRPVPRPDPRVELPRAVPVHEETLTGSPAPPPEKRSYSPPPWASDAETAAVDAMAESRRERVVVPKRSYSPPPMQTVRHRHEYGVNPDTRKWLYGLVAMVLGSTGLSVYSAVKPANVDAPKAVPCQLRCPKGLRELDMSQPPAELQAALQCCEILEGTSAAQAALTESKLARELAAKASDKAAEIEKATPKVNP